MRITEGDRRRGEDQVAFETRCLVLGTANAVPTFTFQCGQDDSDPRYSRINAQESRCRMDLPNLRRE